MKRIHLIGFLAIVMLVLCCGAAQAEPWSGAGTEANPWKITSAADLAALREYILAGERTTTGKYFKQTQDISLSAVCGNGIGDWTPIGIFEGSWDADTHYFDGTFDGNGHTISGLYIGNGGGGAGLFGELGPHGVIKGLTVKGSVNATGMRVGGMLGYLLGKVDNCHFVGTVTSTGNRVGGIAGSSGETVIGIFNSTVEGNISGVEDVGGICGQCNCTIQNCHFSGNVTGTGEDVGGIAGYSSGNIQNCHFSGTVTGTDEVGGIVGYSHLDSTVADCEADVDVHCSRMGGGIVGSNFGTINNCTARGTVEGSQNLGGIAGSCGRWIYNSTNYCSVTGTGIDVGGIAGAFLWACEIKGCVNYGNVSSTNNYVGGIAGSSMNKGDLLECVNRGKVTGAEYVGGITGQTEGDIKDCENHSSVTGTNYVGGIVGCYGVDSGYIPIGGYSDISIVNCLNYGDVSGQSYVGDIAGKSRYGVSITLNPNGMPGEAQSVGLYSLPITLPDCPYSNSNSVFDNYGWKYEFFAWNTAADGSGTWYHPGDDAAAMNGATLYAIWMTGDDRTFYYDPVTDNDYVVQAWFLRDYCPASLPEGCYAVSNWAWIENELPGRITFNGNTKLILMENAVLRAPKGFHVAARSSLTIYSNVWRSASNATITIASPPANCAAIGGNSGESGGTITFYDGNFSITAGDYATGIGGGKYGGAGNVTIGGGTFTIGAAPCNFSTAIGTGAEYNGTNGGTVTINGGTINAIGSFGSAIGSGNVTNGINVVINGGDITATAYYGGAGIGTGPYGSGGTITINGGTVHAYGASYTGGRGAAGIGSGRARNSDTSGNSGTITINGGTVYATGGDNAQAIGVSNEIADHDSGTLTVRQGLAVYVGDSTTAADVDDRAAAARNHSVRIMPHNEHTLSLNDDYFLCCSQCGEVIEIFDVGYGTVYNPYRIGATTTTTQLSWDEWANPRMHGYISASTYFVLTEDIETSVMFGTEDHPFTGHFNGAEHTLTFNCTSAENYCAPFRYVGAAEFLRLRVAGTIHTSAQYAGGLVGKVQTSCNITDCVSSVSIVSSLNRAAGHGGFVGSGTCVTVTGCVFNGSILGGVSTYCGGFLGWTEDDDSICIDCVYDAAVMETTGQTATFIRNSRNVQNSYYTRPIGQGRDFGKQAYSVTAEESMILDFGQGISYGVSGITAYETGLVYNGAFCAGEGDIVTLGLTADLWDGYALSFTASAGALTETEDGWAFTMADENAVISAVRTPTFATTPAVHLTYDGSSGGYDNQGAEKMFDGLDNTKWCVNFTGNNWVEFHTDIPVAATSYAMKTGGDTKRYPGRNPVSWRLLGKMITEDSWTVLVTETNNDHLPAENCVEVFFPLNTTAGYQYYRLEVTAIEDKTTLQLSEFSLVGTPVFGTAAFTMPSALTAIEESAFEGMTAMTVVDAGHCTAIGSNAFKDCTALTRIRLPKNCTIDTGAFTGCGTIYIFAPAGGSTETFCQGQGNFVFVAE